MCGCLLHAPHWGPGPNEITKQNSRKRTKQNVDKQSFRCRVQNSGYKDAQGT